MDMTLNAYVNGVLAGHLDYSTFDDDVAVQMVFVEPDMRRKGVGSALLRELQRMYPGTEIDLGMLTDDGAKLIDATAFDEVPNGDIPEKLERLAAVKAQLADYERRSQQDPGFRPNDWNDLHDEEWRLEDETKFAKPTRKIIRQPVKEADDHWERVVRLQYTNRITSSVREGRFGIMAGRTGLRRHARGVCGTRQPRS
jgi:hypothetical protein